MSEIAVGEAAIRHREVDGAEAGRKLFEEAAKNMERIDFGFLFTSSKFNIEKLVNGLESEMEKEDAEWVGVSTAGEISSRGSTKGGAVLLLIGSGAIEFRVGKSRDIHENPVESGKEAAEEAVDQEFLDSENNRMLFTLMSGLTQRWEGVEFEVLKGINNATPDIPVSGGSAGDDASLRKTLQFHSGEIYEDAVLVTAIESELPIRKAQGHGFNEKVASGVVSSSDGRVIEEISGQNAVEFYADAVGEPVKELRKPFDLPVKEKLFSSLNYVWLKLKGEKPLMVHRVFQYSLEKALAVEMSPGNYRILTPVQVGSGGELVMTAGVEENQAIHVLEGERDRIVSAARDAFGDIPEDEESVFALVADCANRGMLLDEDERQREIQLLKDELGSPLAGFYGYGEIGGKGEKFSTFRNQTVSGFAITREKN